MTGGFKRGKRGIDPNLSQGRLYLTSDLKRIAEVSQIGCEFYSNPLSKIFDEELQQFNLEELSNINFDPSKIAANLWTKIPLGMLDIADKTEFKFEPNESSETLLWNDESLFTFLDEETNNKQN